MTVIAFTKKEPPKPRIWQCNCDCQAFWLYEDGRIQCMGCDAFANTMQGYWAVVVAEAEQVDPRGPRLEREGMPLAPDLPDEPA